MEFQIIDLKSMDLTDRILPLMALYSDSPNIKPEFIQNTVEVASNICTSLQELESQVILLVADLLSKCHSLDSTICGAGTHPFSQQLAILTPIPRYLRLEKQAAIQAHIQITFSTHVHVGMKSGEEAISLMRRLKPYLPLLIAVSASSPFWRGYDTGFASYRHRILSATRSYGIPPSFEDWHAFSDFFDTTQEAGVFESINDIHWDIRPRPHLGTLEVRVMDAQSSVADSVSLAGLVRSLIHFLRNTEDEELPEELPCAQHWWIEKENYYQASFLGMEGKYINDGKESIRSLYEVFDSVADAIKDSADELGQSEHLDCLKQRVKNSLGYNRQRHIYKKTNSLQAVVSSLVRDIESETGISKL